MSATFVQSQSTHLMLGGKSIEVAIHAVPSPTNTILLLHEALGSVSYWKDFPQRLAQETGSRVLLYSRPGHGSSQGPPERRSKEHYLRQVQDVIPEILRHFSVESPILYGHSEGSGIAVLYSVITNQAKALILESPHVVPERSTYLHIKKMADEYPGSKLQQRLARYHLEADAVFHAWTKWASTMEKNSYPLRDMLAHIHCPVLALQGANDDFGTTAHLDALKTSIPNMEFEIYPDTGHLPHRERTDLVLARVARFVGGLQHSVDLRDHPIPRFLFEKQA
jgi:pimeloyl-ACP methyl ester carboxylesterase